MGFKTCLLVTAFLLLLLLLLLLCCFSSKFKHFISHYVPNFNIDIITIDMLSLATTTFTD